MPWHDWLEAVNRKHWDINLLSDLTRSEGKRIFSLL